MVTFGFFTRSRPGLSHGSLRLFLTLALTINAASPAHADDAGRPSSSRQELWVEAELEPDTLHVEAQARYTLRLYQAVSVRELAFHGPASPLAEIRELGENVHEMTRHGQRYRVTERRYAVFPFASGTLHLTGGYVAVNTGGASSSRHRIEAPALTLDVRPAPTGHRPGTWLPARSVTLSESWQPDAAELHPGQALRRTIRVEATGVAASLIPPLSLEMHGFTVHPEPARLEEREEDGWTTGVREQTWRLVPQQTGKLPIPALQLPWWDPITGQPRQTTLAGRSVTALAPEGAQGTAADEPQAPAASTAHPSGTPSPSPGDPTVNNIGGRLLAVLALVLAASASAYRYRATRTLRRIRRACRNNDPVAAREALLQWSREIGAPGPANLLTLAQHLGGGATRRELATLDRHLYGEARPPWNGRDLIAALRGEHRRLHPCRLWRFASPVPRASRDGAPAHSCHRGGNTEYML